MLIYLQMIETFESKEKFEQIYLMYRCLMYHVAFKILHNREDAEDAVHQAFLSVIKILNGISTVDSIKTRALLVLITERKAIDIFRTRSKTITVDYSKHIHGLMIPPPSEHRLANAMARLPVQARELLLLRFYYGYSTKEIAKMLNIKRDTIQKQIWRAKLELQRELDEEETHW